MAGYRRGRTSRGNSRSSYAPRGRTARKSTYRSRSAGPTRRRASSSRTGGRSQTIKIEFVGGPSGGFAPASRPEIGMMPAGGPRKKMF